MITDKASKRHYPSAMFTKLRSAAGPFSHGSGWRDCQDDCYSTDGTLHPRHPGDEQGLERDHAVLRVLDAQR
jgi:hypothetical protein